MRQPIGVRVKLLVAQLLVAMDDGGVAWGARRLAGEKGMQAAIGWHRMCRDIPLRQHLSALRVAEQR